mmetsp:Transcript_148358/g.210742  ORF Transcript_148358/g.210742 Transcript_148358/m.210742 type:complete len:183 (-) Transcript_148358:45-593(-)
MSRLTLLAIFALLAISARADVQEEVTQWYSGMFAGAKVGNLTDLPACVSDPSSYGIIQFYQGWANAVGNMTSTGLIETLSTTNDYISGQGAKFVASVKPSVWTCIQNSKDDQRFKKIVGVTLSPNDKEAKLKFIAALTLSSTNRANYKKAFSKMSEQFGEEQYYDSGDTYTTFASSLSHNIL